MDEGLLNDLLECSVCLERLDTSSRVLPCQHTFCLKCLKVIVDSHKELRCPECRVLVETKVEELPPNVLLMRILEGMRNSAPRKPGDTQRATRSGHSQVRAMQSGQPSRDGKQLPPHARAMYDYFSKEPGDLSFKKGDTIILQKKLDPYWYHGECSGRTGMFPITYVQVIIPLQVPTALCKALYDFRMSAPDEEGCLAFDKGTIITVHRRVDENWAEGRVEQRVGIFPIAFVELNQAARHLMNSSPPNRPVPPAPDQSRPNPDHRHAQHSHRYLPMSSSMPTGQSNYQNVGAMSQSHPNFQPGITTAIPAGPLAGPLTTISTASPIASFGLVNFSRNIVESSTKHSLDLIQFHSKGSVAVQAAPRIADGCDRIRAKFDFNPAPVKNEQIPVTVSNYANATITASYANTANLANAANTFTNTASSDSSSSVNTPSVSTTTPNTSSDASTCESNEPSLPSSPDNADRHSANTAVPEPEVTLDASMGVLSLNESSTATNTSLNVSLPPADSPKQNTSGVNQNESENQESVNGETARLDVPSSSKNGTSGGSGPDSLLNFGLGLQAVLSLSHGKEGSYLAPRSRDSHRDREKRHSLTPSSHLQGSHSQNRHSAEIVSTSLLDAPGSPRSRRRRERSAERSLPAAYIAIYPYKPQKPDELELRKGAVYLVTERCRDGWYKGWAERSPRAGVFPGNYVAPHQHKHDKVTAPPSSGVARPSPVPPAPPPPPDAPPRAESPHNNTAQPLMYSWSPNAQSLQNTPRLEKSKEKSKLEKSSISTGVSLMKRLAAMKKCKSPPPTGYSMDNPVFEDGPGTSLNLPSHHHPVHVRSGSCPSQLLRALPAPDRRHKERHLAHLHRSNESPWQSQHRKSQSLDVTATRRDRHHAQTVKERFRCIVPYPPNSEYELELKVDDIVIVSKKRGDGWYKGTLQRTGRTGLFPASFVQSCPTE